MSEVVSEVAQSCPTVCDPMDCKLPGSSIHGIFQARVLEWGAMAFSRGSSWPRDWTPASCIVGRRFTIWATRLPQFTSNSTCPLVNRLFFGVYTILKHFTLIGLYKDIILEKVLLLLCGEKLFKIWYLISPFVRWGVCSSNTLWF